MKYVGILVVASVLLVGFGYFTIFSGPEVVRTPAIPTDYNSSREQGESPTDPQTREAFAGAGTMQSLLERGDSIECQITYTPSPLEEPIVGTFFVANGKVRGDFLTPAPDLNGQVLSSLIFTGEQIYVWSEIGGEQYGFTIEANTLNAAEANAPVPVDTEVQYDCLTWPAVDYTIFEAPTAVLFTDMTGVQAQMEFGTVYEDEAGEF